MGRASQAALALHKCAAVAGLAGRLRGRRGAIRRDRQCQSVLRALYAGGSRLSSRQWRCCSAVAQLLDQTHLAGVVNRLRVLRTFQIVVGGVELPDQLVQLEGSFPDLVQQTTARAAAPNAALPVGGWVEPSVFGATAIELPGSNLQTRTNPYTVTGSARPAKRAAGRGRATQEQNGWRACGARLSAVPA